MGNFLKSTLNFPHVGGLVVSAFNELRGHGFESRILLFLHGWCQVSEQLDQRSVNVVFPIQALSSEPGRLFIKFALEKNL